MSEAVEDFSTLDEEAALLLEEGLEGRQIDDGRVDLGLAEVGVDRDVERHAAADACLQIEPGGSDDTRAVVEWISRFVRGDEFTARRGIRHNFKMAAGTNEIEADQVRHPRGETAVFLGNVLEPVGFVFAPDESRHVEAPGLVLRGREAQLRKRDAELGRPALIVDRDGRSPDGVPRAVFAGVVGNDRITLHARGAHDEFGAGQMVVPRIEENRHGICVRAVVPIRQAP